MAQITNYSCRQFAFLLVARHFCWPPNGTSKKIIKKRQATDYKLHFKCVRFSFGFQIKLHLQWLRLNRYSEMVEFGRRVPGSATVKWSPKLNDKICIFFLFCSQTYVLSCRVICYLSRPKMEMNSIHFTHIFCFPILSINSIWLLLRQHCFAQFHWTSEKMHFHARLRNHFSLASMHSLRMHAVRAYSLSGIISIALFLFRFQFIFGVQSMHNYKYVAWFDFIFSNEMWWRDWIMMMAMVWLRCCRFILSLYLKINLCIVIQMMICMHFEH